MRYLITFSYDGSKYNGYQKQLRKHTIQGELEKVLKKLNNNKKVDINASGRTDAKVHAINQKAHFDLTIDITPDKLKRALNGLLPKDIYVKEVEMVNNDFHARYDVEKKTYIYKINMGEYNPFEKDYVYQFNQTLNVDSMKEAIKYFEGIHDFSSFTKIDEEKDSYVREIFETNIEVKDNIMIISFTGNGFLRYMVRNMVGTLIEVGMNKKKSNDIIEIIAALDRKKAGITANPEGLYLKDVFY